MCVSISLNVAETFNPESKTDVFILSKDFFVYSYSSHKFNREMFKNGNHCNGVGLSKYKEIQGKSGLLRALRTSEEVGISPDNTSQMEERKRVYDSNAPRPMVIPSFCELVWEELHETVLRILIFSSIISLSIGIWRDVSASQKGDPIVFLE